VIAPAGAVPAPGRAAGGPWLVGAVHDAGGDWTVPLAVILATTLAELVPGWPAATPRRAA
jgi:cyanate permease